MAAGAGDGDGAGDGIDDDSLIATSTNSVNAAALVKKRTSFQDDNIHIDCSESAAATALFDTRERSCSLESDSHVIKATDRSPLIGVLIIQILPPLLLSGVGLVSAGTLLDHVQHWPVFEHVTELFILVPTLLGLKGNLEMTLASRLSTAAHSGSLDSSSSCWASFTSNMATIQVQAIVVAGISALISIVLGIVFHRTENGHVEFSLEASLLTLAASLITASVSSGVLGSLMFAIIVFSRKYDIDPDNVATPLAASLGDLVTLVFLSSSAHLLYVMRSMPWISLAIIIGLLLIVPLCCLPLGMEQSSTRNLLKFGWSPILAAMAISSCSGMVFEHFVSHFESLAVLSPVLNGIGGNISSIQASRVSTSLNLSGEIPSHHRRTGYILTLLCIPIHLIFFFSIEASGMGHTRVTASFVIMYMIAASFQVGVLVSLASPLVFWIFKRGADPDNVVLPYLTSVGDLIGSLLLALVFSILFRLGQFEPHL